MTGLRSAKTNVPVVRRRWLPLWAVLVVLANGCATPALEWPGQEPEDPKPSGPRYLRFYKEAHYRALGDRFSGGVTSADFCRQLAAARVLYLGDHHSDHDLHARMLALLDELRDREFRLHLGLECLGTEDTPALQSYLAGDLDLEVVAERARDRWPGSWLTSRRLDQAFYRELLRRAKAHRWPVFALEPTPRLPLFERDQVIAGRVRTEADAHPKDLIVVIVGHTHLLGEGALIERVGLPHVAIGARLSVTLAAAGEAQVWAPTHRFARASSGVLFALPLPPHAEDADR